MKRTYNKLLLRGVRKTAARFFSIVAIVALGVGFLGGLLATTPDMQLTADKYYDDYRLYDLNVKGTLGITDADVQAIAALNGVQSVMPARVTDLEMQTSDGSFVTRIYGVDLNARDCEDFLNDFELIEGRMPENPGECLIASPNGYAGGHAVGEVYTISDDNRDYDSLSDTYRFTELTAVGIVRTPQYMSIESESSTAGNGRVGLIMYVFAEDYSLEVYTDAFVALDGARALNSFSDDYAALLDRFDTQLEQLGLVRSPLRQQEVRADAQTELDDARAEYDDAKAEADRKLADARKKLDDAAAELNDAKTQLADGRSELDSAKQKLTDSEAEIQKNIAALDEAQTSLDGQIAAKKAELEAQKPYLTAQQYAYAAAQIEAARESGMSEISAGRAAIVQAKADLTAAREKLAASEQELADRETQYADGRSELEKGEREYAESAETAQTELADAERRIQDAQAQIDDIEQPEWYVFDRRDNVSFHSYQGNAEKVGAIARVFPVFFFLVAALVALTTMTRMIEEERMQIGTLKALGYTNGSILFYYVGYGVLASLLGSIAGIVPGFYIFPTVISGAYGMMYTLPQTVTKFYWSYTLIIIPIAVVCVVIATLAACLDQLREKPCALMLPKAPKAGKRILLERVGFLWKRMRFIQKVTARNIFRYKKRFYMTVFGIAGCCALLVTGFGLRDSIHDIVDKQFGELYQYDMMVFVKDQDAVRNDAVIRDFLDSSDVQRYAAVHSENGKAENGGNSESVNLYIGAQPGDITDSILLRDRKTGEPVPFDGHGAVLTEKLCEQLGLSAGDTVTLADENGKKAEFTVSGVCENYVAAYAFIGADEYRSAFAREPEYRLLLVSLGAEDEPTRNRISGELLQSENILTLQFSQTIRESFANTVKSIDSIVLVLIVSAGLLAVVVLYNLTNINICERKKELATIKVLGFYEKEVASYIYRETSVLCVLGVLAGFVFGTWLHSFVVRTAEIDAVMFGRSINVTSFLLAALVTAVFTVIVDLLMLGKLRSIDMVESMKANE